jgi:predicted GNAT family acetyltransferase
MTDIVHNEAQCRFEHIVDGYLCELDYQLDDQRMSILHTVVPTEVGGRGLAALLTCAALDTARSRGWRVQPICSYAATYIQRHPEYADLLG